MPSIIPARGIGTPGRAGRKILPPSLPSGHRRTLLPHPQLPKPPTRDGGRVHVTPRHPNPCTFRSLAFSVSTPARYLGGFHPHPARLLWPLPPHAARRHAASRRARARGRGRGRHLRARRSLRGAPARRPLPLPRAQAASPAGGVAVLAVLKSSYKLSKNTSKVVEGFLGLQLHKGFRNGIDALGVVVKVAVIVSEVAVWVGARFWGYGRSRCVRFLGFTRPTGLVLLGCSKSEPQVALFDPVIVGMDAQGCELEERGLSELFSLAVPVPQATTLMSMS